MIDNISGTTGNDTIIGDAASTSAADQVNGGAGVDTLKLYGTTTKPVLSNIESIYLNAPAGAFDISTISGVTSLEVDAEAGSRTFTMTTGQSVKLSNLQTTGQTQTVAGNAAASVDLTLNKVGKADGSLSQVAAVSQTVDLSGTTATTLNLTASTADSHITLTNTGGKLAKMTVAGDKAVTVVEALASLNTIDASAATGNVVVKAGGSANVLTFTGGSGNDAVWFSAGEFTGADKLDGGAGDDKIVIAETGALTTQNYTDLNTYKGFEVMGFSASGASVNLSNLTNGINSFVVQAGNNSATVSNSLSTTKYSIDNTSANTGTVTISNKVGETATTLTVDNQAGASKTVAKVVLTGATNVALTSSGNANSANVISELVNADNSAITLTGSTDLTLSLKKVATGNVVVGSKVDGSAFTGKLVIEGNTTAYSAGSSIGDNLIGGSGADTLKASINNSSLTGNAGADTFDVSIALGGVASITTITDFTKADKLKVVNTGTSVFTAAKVDLSGAASVAAALDTLAAGAGNVNGIVKWGNYGGNTYVVNDNGAGATFAATDIAVKLVGTLDLSTSTYATDTLTFA